MLERTERISFQISLVLSKVEPEPVLHIGSGSDRLRNTVQELYNPFCALLGIKLRPDQHCKYM